MSSALPAQPAQPAQPFQRRQSIQLCVIVAAGSAALGYLIADLERTALLPWLPRAAVVVAAVALLLWISEVRQSRQLARAQAEVEHRLAHIEQCLQRSEYWRAYSDVLADLGGIDPDTSGDIPRVQL